VVRGTVYANAGVIGGNTIDATSIHSGTTGYGTGAGFYLGSDGRFSLSNKLTWDGTTLTVNGGGIFTGNVSGGQFTTGAYTGYAWPAINNYGTYLGPSGLLIGNANNGKYLQVTQDGNIYTPGFNVVNGTMTVNQANVINTLNIAGNAVTTMNSGSGGGACSTTLYVPAYQTMRVVGIGFFAQFTPSNVTEGSYYPVLTINGTSISGFVMRIGSYATLPGSSSSILVNYVDVYGGASGLTCTLSISGTYNNTGTNKIIGFGTLR